MKVAGTSTPPERVAHRPSRRRVTGAAVAVLALALPLVAAVPASAGAPAASVRADLSRAAGAPIPEAPTLGLVGTYRTDEDPETAGGEVAALRDDRMYVINGTTLQLVDVADPTGPTLTETVDLSAYGGSITSVAVGRFWAAAVLPAAVPTDPGTLVLLRKDGRVLRTATVGALPDMVTFDSTGLRLLVANEGEPSSYGQPDSIDPVGSVSLVNAVLLALGFTRSAVRTIGFTDFDDGGPRAGELPEGVRIFGPGATVAQDLEPEYIAVDPANPFRAWVSLQENNAVAELDLLRARVSSITPLGTKDFSVEGAGLDPSDRDGAIAIAPWPVQGLRQPDAIAALRAKGRTYLVTANEGDARDYDGFDEAVRVGDEEYPLDPTAFPEAEALKADDALGRLNVTSVDGRTPDGSAYDQITGFGARSFSVWQPGKGVVWDSGDDFERITAARLPGNFNSDNDEDTFDTRSDDKGPEPEGIAVGEVGGRTLAFIGLERVGGLMVYDVSDPRSPRFSQYLNNRVFGGGGPVGPDSGPEVVSYVAAGDSPNGEPLVLVSNEVSGTVSLYQEVDADGAGALSLLHNNDGESSLLPFDVTAGGTSLPVGGVAAFKAVTDREIASARAAGNAVVDVYAGDSFLASSTLACSLPPNPADTPVYDAVAQRQLPYDAHVFGNHEFDFSPDFLERFVRTFEDGTAANQPFLSANLDFSGEPSWADLIDEDGLVVVGQTEDGRVVGRSAVVNDLVTGQRFGIVAATTPSLSTISSPRNVEVTTDDNASTAAVVQAEIDRLQSLGVKKIVFVSHLQDVNNDRQLIQLLRGVDVAVAGGGDELLADPGDPLLPGDPAPVGPYPILETDADGRTVAIVTTSGNYKYLGRLDVEFDAAGEVVTVDADASYPRRVVPQSEGATALGLTDAVTPDPRLVETVVEPVQACLAELGEPIAATESELNVSRAGYAAAPGVGVRTAETNGGNLVTDGFLDSYDRYAAGAGLAPRSAANPVVAVQNGGGIRQNAGDALEVGPISRADTLNVLAFLTNTMTVVTDLTPEQLKEVFERSVGITEGAADSCGGGGQFLQVAGLRVVYDCAGPAQVVSNPPPGSTNGAIVSPGSRVVTLALDSGTPGDPADDVLLVDGGAVVAGAPAVDVVTNSFTAAGGDNYPTLAGLTDKVNLPATYEQALVEYLTGGAFPVVGGLPTIPATDERYASLSGQGRITLG